MSTTTKRDLIDRVAQSSGLPRADVRKIINDVFELMQDDLSTGNRIEFRKFGVFEVRERRARTAKNPKTNARVEVPSKFTVRFKPGRELKEGVNARLASSNGAVVVVAQEISREAEAAV